MLRLMNRVFIHGHAIVSADDRIADAQARMPLALLNDADFAYFQAHLDAADITVLGRLGHEAHPNIKGRRRLVVSSRANGLERCADANWWNPLIVPWKEVVARHLPNGGNVAVPGGRRVFDLFLDIGYDSFHLARNPELVIPDGVPLFSQCSKMTSPETKGHQAARAEAVLSRHGLMPQSSVFIDDSKCVTRVVWKRIDLDVEKEAG